MFSYTIHDVINSLMVISAPFSVIYCLFFFQRNTVTCCTAPVQIKLTSGTWFIRGRPARCQRQLAFMGWVCTANIVSSLSPDAQTQAKDPQHTITGGGSLLVSEHRENTSHWQMTLQQEGDKKSLSSFLQICYGTFLLSFKSQTGCPVSGAPHMIRRCCGWASFVR